MPNESDDNRNATASWSGYLHQGQVGILVVLRKINELLNSNENSLNCLDGWQIKYEQAEDFDIVDSEGNFVSRHQVKATYKDNLFMSDSLFKFVFKGISEVDREKFNTLIGLIDDFDINTNIIQQISDIVNIEPSKSLSKFKKENLNAKALTKLLECLDKLRKSYFKKINKNYELLNNGENYLHVTCEISDFTFSNPYNENNLNLWNYSDSNSIEKLYCKQLEVEDLMLKEIKLILENQNHPDSNNDIKIKQRHSLLQQLLTNKILIEHQLNLMKPNLLFSDLYNIIVSQSDLHDMALCTYRNLLINTGHKFISDEIINNREEDLDIDGIENSINEIIYLSDDIFFNFLKGIFSNYEELPNKITSEIDYVNLFNEQGVRSVFLHCINSLEHHYCLKDSLFIYESNNDYILTAIVEDENKELSVREHILKNIQLGLVPFKEYEDCYLINKEIDASFMDIQKLEDYDEDKFFRPKSLNLISKKSIKEIL